jgi:hypothetical protein
VRRHAIDDRAHRVLAYAEVHVAAAVTPTSAVRTLLIDIAGRRRIEIA